MSKNLLMLIVVLLLSPGSASAGKIAEIFSGEIFGVRWGSTVQQVAAVFPDGKSKEQFGHQTYKTLDGKTLFGVKRNPDNYIQFVFNAEGQMNGVNIEFPDGTDGFGTLLNKLDTYFGEHTSLPNAAATVVQWPEDSGIRITLGYIPSMFGKGGVLFSIGYLKAESSATKEKLGF
jgi:hypothetical protein